MIIKTILVFITAFISFSLSAAPLKGNAEAGKPKSETCGACHGADGNSQNPEWPKLAGQHAVYIQKQLMDFKSGARKNPIMSPTASSLTDQDMADLSAYFSSQKKQLGTADQKLIKLGQKIYRGGNALTNVPACMACHGPNGAGNPAIGFPSLSGQHAAYTNAQLRAYKSGERENDQAEIMRSIAKKMSDREMEAVASYIQGLR